MQNLTHYLPILSSAVSLTFAAVLFRHAQRRPGALYLVWWALGVLLYAAGTLTEAFTALWGWNLVVFKLWYIAGALLGGAPLAQGTVYLLLPRSVAHRLAVGLVVYVAAAALCVALAPVNLALVEPTRLSGSVLAWQWVRLFSPFPNTYALIFLVGGALWSARRYWQKHTSSQLVWGNVLIAAGALLPGIGGSFTRLGYVEVLYITELIGILLIWWGYAFIEAHPPAESTSA